MDSTAQLRLEPTPEFSLYSYEAVPANCLLTLKAAAVEEADRAPVSCTFVLDTSGSMAGNKLDLMRKASRFSLRHLAEKDRLGIIAFATEVRSRLSVAPVESEHRESATRMLQNMGAGGATGLSEALFEGVSQQLSCARASSDQPPDSLENPEAIERPQLATTDTSSPSDLVRAVFLFTDGQANRGLTRQADIVQALKNTLAATAEGAEDSTLAEQQGGHTHTSPQITVHTFGFGHDANPDMLAAIADTGSGTYYYIDTADAIPAAFADALGGILSVAAQNIVLRISPVNGARIRRVRCGFDTHAEGADYIVRVPDVYAEEARDLVVALELPAQHSAEPGGVEFVAAEVRVEFIDIVRAMPAVVVGEVRVKRSAETPVEQSSADANARVRSQITRLDATEAMQRVCPASSPLRA